MIDDVTPEEEAGLPNLLELIQGKRWMGAVGIATYPTAPEDGQQVLHRGCLILEQRGLIERKQETDQWVFWVPKA